MSKTYLRNHTNIGHLIDLIDEHDIVVVDLDDVIMTTKSLFCSSTWFFLHQNKNSAIETFMKCAKHVPFLAVSEELNSKISSISNSKLVFALTAREPSMADYTLKNLQTLNMSFTNNYTFQGLKDGIIFKEKDSSGKFISKGQALVSLLDNVANAKASSILFIDDSEHNTVSAKEFLWDRKDLNVTIVHFSHVFEELYSKHEEEYLRYVGHKQEEYFHKCGDFLPGLIEAPLDINCND